MNVLAGKENIILRLGESGKILSDKIPLGFFDKGQKFKFISVMNRGICAGPKCIQIGENLFNQIEHCWEHSWYSEKVIPYVK